MTLTPKFSYLPSFGLVCSTLNTNQLSTTIYKPVANVIEKKIETLIPIRSSNYVIEKKLLVYMIEMVCTYDRNGLYCQKQTYLGTEGAMTSP